MSERIRVGFIGCGGIARHHIRGMLRQLNTPQIEVICEPSPEAYAAAVSLFTDVGQQPPPNQPDFEVLLDEYRGRLDAVFIATPHAYHHAQAKASLEAGFDVLLEKPMVMNEAEAHSLIEARDRTGRLLVVAFQGSLSPQVRTAVRMLRAGDLGTLLNINAMAWQNWNALTAGSWRQQPEIAGGGFLFDTGAHMLNTVSDLVGEPFVEVAAWLDPHNRPVDITGVVIARLKSGAMVTMNGCGDASSIGSDIRVFCSEGILRTGIWGERLELQRRGEEALQTVELPASTGAWEQFVAVRQGIIPNPCPPEVGLRMISLWDAIKHSAAQGGALVTLPG